MSGSTSGYLTIEGNVYGPNNITDIYFNGTIINKDDCTLDTCSLLIADFHYLPNLPGNYFFLALFAALFVANIPIGIFRKTWGFLIAMCCGLVLETVGYAGRVMAHSNPFSFNAFILYIVCLTIAPAFITAAIYLCLARILVVYGESNARFKPRTYSIVFMVSDFIALVLQGAGGGLAATADTESSAQTGINIMIAGLAWQVASLLLFMLACGDFASRVRAGKGVANPSFLDFRASTKWTLFLGALATATFTIFVRSVYRVAELSQGFSGSIADMEVPYMILEPTMIFIATIALTVLHPGTVFGRRWNEANFRLNGKINDNEMQALKSSSESSQVSGHGQTQFAGRY